VLAFAPPARDRSRYPLPYVGVRLRGCVGRPRTIGLRESEQRLRIRRSGAPRSRAEDTTRVRSHGSCRRVSRSPTALLPGAISARADLDPRRLLRASPAAPELWAWVVGISDQLWAPKSPSPRETATTDSTPTKGRQPAHRRPGPDQDARQQDRQGHHDSGEDADREGRRSRGPTSTRRGAKAPRSGGT